MGIAAGIVTILIVWCIANTWDQEEPEEEPDLPQDGNGTQADPGTQAGV